jgi:hypothetical protein
MKSALLTVCGVPMDEVLAAGPVDSHLGLAQGLESLFPGGGDPDLLDGRAKCTALIAVPLGAGDRLSKTLLGGLDLRHNNLVFGWLQPMMPDFQASVDCK